MDERQLAVDLYNGLLRGDDDLVVHAYETWGFKRLDRALIDALRKPFPIAGVEVFVTTSVGIALGKDVDQLFRRADVAMYRAKSAGKAQYALYAPWMDDAVLGRLERTFVDETMRTADALEGIASFGEKRAPVWVDR